LINLLKMPPVKRRTKKEIAAAAAAAAALAASDAAAPSIITAMNNEGNQDGENNAQNAAEAPGSAAVVAPVPASVSVPVPVPIDDIPIVMKLPISSKRVEEIIKSDESRISLDNEPKPYIKENSFISENDNLEKKNNDKAHHNHHETICYWCCHNIINTEYGMPVRYDVFYNNFTMYGSFCSLECAAAYNFSINMGCDRAWEIHSWIQLLAQNYGLETPIRPAPNRYLLNMFNGPVSIDEFREGHKGFLKTYVMNIPPFIHITSQLELLNTSFLEKSKDTLGVSKSKISKISKLVPEQKMISI